MVRGSSISYKILCCVLKDSGTVETNRKGQHYCRETSGYSQAQEEFMRLETEQPGERRESQSSFGVS